MPCNKKWNINWRNELKKIQLFLFSKYRNTIINLIIRTNVWIDNVANGKWLPVDLSVRKYITNTPSFLMVGVIGSPWIAWIRLTANFVLASWCLSLATILNEFVYNYSLSMNLVHGISPIRRRFIIHIAKPYIPDPFSFLQKKKLSFNFFYNYLILISRFVLSPFHSFIVYSLSFFFFFFEKISVPIYKQALSKNLIIMKRGRSKKAAQWKVTREKNREPRCGIFLWSNRNLSSIQVLSWLHYPRTRSIHLRIHLSLLVDTNIFVFNCTAIVRCLSPHYFIIFLIIFTLNHINCINTLTSN